MHAKPGVTMANLMKLLNFVSSGCQRLVGKELIGDFAAEMLFRSLDFKLVSTASSLSRKQTARAKHSENTSFEWGL